MAKGQDKLKFCLAWGPSAPGSHGVKVLVLFSLFSLWSHWQAAIRQMVFRWGWCLMALIYPHYTHACEYDTVIVVSMELFAVAQKDDFVSAMKKSPASYPLINHISLVKKNYSVLQFICADIQSWVFVCLWVSEWLVGLLPINSAPLWSTLCMIHILNWHDPGSALVHTLFALTYVKKLLFEKSFE